MDEGKPDLGRRASEVMLSVVGVFNLVASAIFVIVGLAAVSIALHFTQVREGRVVETAIPPGVNGAILLAYAALLFASGIGLLRRLDWGWYVAFAAAGVSALLALLDALHRAWGAMLFDLAYAGVVAACLLKVRRG